VGNLAVLFEDEPDLFPEVEVERLLREDRPHKSDSAASWWRRQAGKLRERQRAGNGGATEPDLATRMQAAMDRQWEAEPEVVLTEKFPQLLVLGKKWLAWVENGANGTQPQRLRQYRDTLRAIGGWQVVMGIDPQKFPAPPEVVASG